MVEDETILIEVTCTLKMAGTAWKPQDGKVSVAFVGSSCVTAIQPERAFFSVNRCFTLDRSSIARYLVLLQCIMTTRDETVKF